MTHRADKPIETLRLSAEQKQRLVAHVNQSYQKPVPQERRSPRVPYLAKGAIIAVRQPNGNLSRHAVLTRNLSSGGLSFMVGRFIYHNSPAEVILPMLDGRGMIITGRIVRCRLFEGIIHECAVMFDEALDINLFVNANSSPPVAVASEINLADEGQNVPAAGPAIKPLVLIVDDFKNDRRLFCLWMEKLGFQTLEAHNVAGAEKIISENNVEMALINRKLGDEDGLELVKKMRSDGFGGPILVASADDDQAFRVHARGAGADEYMTKPFDQLDLKLAIDRLFTPGEPKPQPTTPIRSDLAGNDAMKPLLRDFVAGLGQTADQLDGADPEQDQDAIADLCLELKGSGSGYGFPQISKLALLVLDQLETEQTDVEVLKKTVVELTTMLRRAKAE
ncbi:MAG: response regulator [Phycisphaeraceae bacterium]|nr:response regulator [Phycisphaeraceae bacterium]